MCHRRWDRAVPLSGFALLAGIADVLVAIVSLPPFWLSSPVSYPA
jgi:hypothetical protein